MRLRQVALVTHRLEPVVDELVTLLGVEVACRDPGVGVFGLENAVLPVGDTFLEVLAPVRQGTSAGRLLERRGGDAGYMVILQVGDLAAERRRLDALGVRVVWEAAFPDMATIHLHPRDVGGAIVSLDWADPPAHWRWAGPDWEKRVHTDVATAVTGVEIQADDPAATAARWSEVLAREARADGDGFAIALEGGGRVRFAPATEGRGEGVAGVELALADAGRFAANARALGCLGADGAARVCGTRFAPAPDGASGPNFRAGSRVERPERR